MEVFWEIIKILLPSLVVFFTAFYLIRMMMGQELRKKEMDVLAVTKKDITFLRLQAYERLILLMERISLPNLILRTDRTGFDANEYHLGLLTTIRAEFDHNIAQQLYVSDLAWKVVCDSKEEIIKIINLAKDDFTVMQSAIEFSRLVMDKYFASDQPAQKAIDFLKAEARTLF